MSAAAATESPVELLRALGWLTESPGAGHAPVAAALDLRVPDLAAWRTDYTDTFLLQCYPYASVYLGHDGMLGGEPRDRIAGFWRALGLTPPAEPDHLATLLGFYAELAERDGPDPRWQRARRAFLWEHLLSWLPPYLDKVTAIAPAVYRDWAARLGEALALEAEAVGPVDALPLHLRAALPLADPETAGLDAFLGALLAPACSGVLLARADLARAGRELDLGVRLGERRFILRHLLSQDAPGALAWLRDEAARAAGAHRRHRETTGEVAIFWAGRAQSTAERLDRLVAAPPVP